jgi:hypothetical protein
LPSVTHRLDVLQFCQVLFECRNDALTHNHSGHTAVPPPLLRPLHVAAQLLYGISVDAMKPDLTRRCSLLSSPRRRSWRR